ncbi:MAG: hypothetical protein Tsb009_10900 [Planctomycetaceae bacterium]
MASTTFAIRVEAVNFDQTIMDTEDLSTIRGSGLMVLELRAPVETAIKSTVPETHLEVITTGASQVVVLVKLNEDKKSDNLTSIVATSLRQNELLRHATLVVDAMRLDSPLDARNYRQTIESLIAMNRLQQLQSARVSPIGLLNHPQGDLDEDIKEKLRNRPWCPVDQVRPAVAPVENVRNENKAVVSRSVADRRQNGFAEKQKRFYKLECDWSPEAATVTRMEIAWDLHQIATFDKSPEYKHLEHPFLDGKIAIIHADGNKFGRYQANRVVGPRTQRAWDERVQNLRREALKKILHEAWDPDRPDWIDPLWWNRSDKDAWRLRLETLLWGGDEFIWVVPAWQGLRVVNFIFETYQRPKPSDDGEAVGVPRRPVKHRKEIRNLNARPSKKDKEAELLKADDPQKIQSLDLSISAGVVFCHANAPIRRTRQLAERLTHLAKQSTGSDRNAFCYAVLESFDQMEDSVLAARIRHLPFPAGPDTDTLSLLHDATIDATRLQKLHSAICWMRAHFPRGAVYRILNVLRCDNLDEALKWINRGLHELDDGQLRQGAGHLALFYNKDARDTQSAVSDDQRINWLHLAELWDYTV